MAEEDDYYGDDDFENPFSAKNSPQQISKVLTNEGSEMDGNYYDDGFEDNNSVKFSQSSPRMRNDSNFVANDPSNEYDEEDFDFDETIEKPNSKTSIVEKSTIEIVPTSPKTGDLFHATSFKSQSFRLLPTEVPLKPAHLDRQSASLINDVQDTYGDDFEDEASEHRSFVDNVDAEEPDSVHLPPVDQPESKQLFSDSVLLSPTHNDELQSEFGNRSNEDDLYSNRYDDKADDGGSISVITNENRDRDNEPEESSRRGSLESRGINQIVQMNNILDIPQWTSEEVAAYLAADNNDLEEPNDQEYTDDYTNDEPLEPVVANENEEDSQTKGEGVGEANASNARENYGKGENDGIQKDEEQQQYEEYYGSYDQDEDEGGREGDEAIQQGEEQLDLKGDYGSTDREYEDDFVDKSVLQLSAESDSQVIHGDDNALEKEQLSEVHLVETREMPAVLSPAEKSVIDCNAVLTIYEVVLTEIPLDFTEVRVRVMCPVHV